MSRWYVETNQGIGAGAPLLKSNWPTRGIAKSSFWPSAFYLSVGQLSLPRTH